MVLHLLNHSLNSIGNIVSPPGFIEHQGIAAQQGGLLNQVSVISLIGQSQGRGHTGDTAADHQGLAVYTNSWLRQGLNQLGPGHGHSHQVFGFPSGLGLLLAVNPGALITDIGHLKKVLVQPRIPHGFLEQRFMGPRGAGRNDNAVQPLSLDNLLDVVLCILGTGEQVFVHKDHARQGFGIFRNLGYVDNAADIDAAITYEDPDTRFLLGNIPLRGVDSLLD